MITFSWRRGATVFLVAWTVGGRVVADELAINRLELVTVTDTGAILTWETNQPADTRVRWGIRADHLDGSAQTEQAPTRYHACELQGLRPGTEYHYVCQSGTARASIGPLSSGRFTTLTPPPGRELFAFATMTDTHVGESRTARLVLPDGKVVSEGVRWREPDLPGWRLVLTDCVDQINSRSVAFTIIKGDITHGTGPEEFPPARQLLDRLRRPYYVVCGNHDALKPFLRTFALPVTWYSFDHQGFHFVVLDTEAFEPVSDSDTEPQFAWLADDLRKHKDSWTFVFCHRPVTPKLNRGEVGLANNSLFAMARSMAEKRGGGTAARIMDTATGRRSVIHRKNAERLAQLFREHGRIAGVFAGHLHRNYVGFWPEQTGNLPYVETASTKEYPCGYAITRVFEGGYMQSYYPGRDPRVLEWSSMTREAYTNFGLGVKAGTLSDRNFVVRFDKLNLTPATTSAPTK